MRDYSFSVCMATYNGGRFITPQLESIISQMDERDELIISDDGSSDDTLDIISRYSEKDKRIKLFKGPHHGFSSNFCNAMMNASNDIIVYSDQDDIWKNNKLDVISQVFEDNSTATTVLHSMTTFSTDEKEDLQFVTIAYKRGVLRNFIRSSYWGCCMAVKRSFIDKALPFRDYCVGHDQLTGLITEKNGNCVFVDEQLIMHRIHGQNTSGKTSVLKAIAFRINLMRDYIYAKRKICSKK